MGMKIVDDVLVRYFEEPDVTEVVVPDRIKEIKMMAFSGCSQIRSVTIPDSVRTIGSSAFSGCTALEHVTLPAGLGVIKGRLFYRCKKLKTIAIPPSVRAIEKMAFQGTALTAVELPPHLGYLDDGAFQGTRLTEITIPASVRTIFDAVFARCKRLRKVTIEGSDCFINGSPFYGTPWLDSQTDDMVILGKALMKYQGSGTEVTIPEGVEVIAPHAFEGREDLTAVTLPRLMRVIHRDAFKGCTHLRRFTVPFNILTRVEEGAFQGCTALSEMTLDGQMLPFLEEVKAIVPERYDDLYRMFLRYDYGIRFKREQKYAIILTVLRAGYQERRWRSYVKTSALRIVRYLAETRDVAGIRLVVTAFPDLRPADLDKWIDCAEKYGAKEICLVLLEEKRRRGLFSEAEWRL